MPRPKLPPEKLKSVRVLVRLTPDQVRQVKEFHSIAVEHGLSTFLRNIIMSVIAGDAA